MGGIHLRDPRGLGLLYPTQRSQYPLIKEYTYIIEALILCSKAYSLITGCWDLWVLTASDPSFDVRQKFKGLREKEYSSLGPP